MSIYPRTGKRRLMKAHLKGDNQIKKFRQIAQRLISKISKHENVTGIIFLGGLTRGFVDKHSDLDVAVLLDGEDRTLRKKILNIATMESRQSAIDIDLEIFQFKKFRTERWNEVDKWDASNAQIAFDPTGAVKHVLKTKVKVPKDFWIRRIAISAEYMKWYCCPPREDVSTIAESWIDRGDLLSAHYCLNYAIDLLLETVFALNREYLPPKKWRIFCFKNLKWLPKNHRLLDEAVRVKNLSAQDLGRRLKALRTMWTAVLPQIEKMTGRTPEKLTRYFVEKILDQIPTH